jgi:hypothetical protein
MIVTLGWGGLHIFKNREDGKYKNAFDPEIKGTPNQGFLAFWFILFYIANMIFIAIQFVVTYFSLKRSV